MCFPVNIARFLRTPILKNICERLLLNTPRGLKDIFEYSFELNIFAFVIRKETKKLSI